MSSRQELMEFINHEYALARQYADNDVGSSLNKCRTIAETILTTTWSKKKGKPCPSGLTIDKLREQLKDEIPGDILKHVACVQNYGNFGSHYQGGEPFDPKLAEISLIATGVLIKWFDPKHKEVDSEPVEIEMVEDIDILADEISIPVTETDEIDIPVEIEIDIPVEIEIDIPVEITVEDIPQDVIVRDYTIRERMRQMITEKQLDYEDVISMREILEWFRQKGSRHKESAVRTHVQMMTTNGETRLFHDLRKDGSDELFFRIKKGQYRLFVTESDPAPITEIEQFSGWEDKLLIVNTSTSYDEVSKFSGYMCPNKTGPYKISRSKYIGLYKEKNVPIIAELVGKVTFRTDKSKGFVWWNNYGLQDDDILQSARNQLRDRDRSDWDEPFPVQVLIFRNQTEVNFAKDSPGGLQRNNRIFSTKGAANLEELSQKINNQTWSEWLG